MIIKQPTEIMSRLPGQAESESPIADRHTDSRAGDFSVAATRLLTSWTSDLGVLFNASLMFGVLSIPVVIPALLMWLTMPGSLFTAP